MNDPEVPKTKEADEDEPVINNQYSVIGKVLSGRFILTVVGAICFAIIVYTICQLLLAKKTDIKIAEIVSILSTILIVISNIFTFYFVRKSMEKDQINGQPPTQ